MKLRLKDKDLPPVQLRLTLPGSLKASLDEYVGYLHDSLHRETDAKEVAIEMLKHFVDSDRDFRGWRGRREGGGERLAGREEQDKGFTVLWTPFVRFSFFGAGFLPRTASPRPVPEQSPGGRCFRRYSARESQYHF